MDDRHCRVCRERRPVNDFGTAVDAAGAQLIDSVCKACTPVRQARGPLATSARSPRPGGLPAETRRLTMRARLECKKALLEYRNLDVQNPVELISGPCMFTGVEPAMCLMLVDPRQPPTDGNVVPCAREVRASRGSLSCAVFVAVCKAAVSESPQDPTTALAAHAMAARYDAAGGHDFRAMCARVSNFCDAQCNKEHGRFSGLGRVDGSGCHRSGNHSTR